MKILFQQNILFMKFSFADMPIECETQVLVFH